VLASEAANAELRVQNLRSANLAESGLDLPRDQIRHLQLRVVPDVGEGG
jgi:hypothetical protein